MELDIGLVRMVAGVVLVVVFGPIEGLERFDGRDHGTRKGPLIIEPADADLGGILLVLICEKNRRAVLRSHIAPLAVKLGGIVCIKEHVEQLFVTDSTGIISDAYGFSMPRVAVAYSLIICGFSRAAGITALDVDHSLELLERRLGAPEAASGEYGARQFG